MYKRSSEVFENLLEFFEANVTLFGFGVLLEDVVDFLPIYLMTQFVHGFFDIVVGNVPAVVGVKLFENGDQLIVGKNLLD